MACRGHPDTYVMMLTIDCPHTPYQLVDYKCIHYEWTTAIIFLRLIHYTREANCVPRTLPMSNILKINDAVLLNKQ